MLHLTLCSTKIIDHKLRLVRSFVERLMLNFFIIKRDFLRSKQIILALNKFGIYNICLFLWWIVILFFTVWNNLFIAIEWILVIKKLFDIVWFFLRFLRCIDFKINRWTDFGSLLAREGFSWVFAPGDIFYCIGIWNGNIHGLMFWEKGDFSIV